MSSSASQVIAEVVPMNLEIERRCVAYKVRKVGEAMFRDSLVRKRECKKRLNRLFIEAWQDR